tara:strand:- start:2409 stop:3335 length:927 start_codon:yes stop_codon:yes gene_type:complete
MLNYSLKLFAYNSLFKNFVDLELNNKLPSRIILSGQEGIGKSTFAFHLINYVFSKNEKTKYDVENNKINIDSKSHNLVSNFTHPNFYSISLNDTKKDIEIDQIRNLISFLTKTSFNNDKKIILIDGAENLNISSSNALLKSLEESNNQNLFILTHNINKKLLDTIKSRCISYKLNFDYSNNPNIILENFGTNLYDDLHDDFKKIIISPSFLIKHIIFSIDNKLELNLLDAETMIKYIIDNKSYKKDHFIKHNFQSYVEVYFTKMYSKTRDYKYYDNYLKTISENNLINKFNLDMDSYFLKFEKDYFNI